MRLDRYVAAARNITRKIARISIQNKEIKLNDSIVEMPYIEINPEEDKVYYKNQLLQHQEAVYFMFYKPMGCITARSDKNDLTVLDYFSEEDKAVFPVGRLDKDTEGLLLLTNDGEWNHRLMHPDMHVEKTYYFHAFGTLGKRQLEQLKQGVNIGEQKLAKAKKIEIEMIGNYWDYERQIIIANKGKLKKIPQDQKVVMGCITITEGRKHQVKRMLKAMDCYVVYLKRMAIGELQLDHQLEKGHYRKLTIRERGMISGKSKGD